jgi:hypothetical protein
MKVKFNRTVKHSGTYYEAGKVYDLSDNDPMLEQLLAEKHTDVFVCLREGEQERQQEVQVAEKAPEDANASPTPAPAERTPRMNNPMMPPAPNVG